MSPIILLTDTAHLDPARRELLAEAVALQFMFDKVLTWAMSLQPPARIARMVAQDEYSHDVVIQFEDVYLVYDAT